MRKPKAATSAQVGIACRNASRSRRDFSTYISSEASSPSSLRRRLILRKWSISSPATLPQHPVFAGGRGREEPLAHVEMRSADLAVGLDPEYALEQRLLLGRHL